MMDEKKRRKLGLSLKVSKKLVIGDKEEFKSKSGLQTQNVKNFKSQLKVNTDHVSSSPVCEPSSYYRCENTSTIDIGIPDSERLLWKNIFSSAETWEDLEDLPKTGVSSSPKKDGTTVTNSEITNIDGINDNLNRLHHDNYIDLPKSCIICCTRKPVQLIYPAIQQTELKTLLPQVKKNASKAANKNIDKEIPIRSSLGDDNKKHDVGGNKRNQKQHHHEQNFILGCHTRDINKEENMTRISMPNNVAIDLTDDNSEHKSDGFKNHWKKKSHGFRSFPGSIDENISKNSHQMLNSCLTNKLVNKPPICSKGTPSKEELKCCPMCQLQFSHRMSKQEIDIHLSSCIGDEVIIDDDSDEDW